ncbi:MFS general substrate transporter [Lindgomyces ingoldianus]|uniref:MFS general substrate transporter n=1 Tax=Lindgomyces ingoldianus TaxID=673940 RepID=A0ACB6R6T4_9PLEO|nr:MFS general substrate transporter [Lindgomyces ingoldianus]KAF2474022.1 MFS general substrate transporter [Lindgomyces ingoldianus]
MAPPSGSSPSSSAPHQHPPNVDGTAASHPKVVSFRRSSSPNRSSMDIISENSPLIQPRTSDDCDSTLKAVSPIESDDWQGDTEDSKSSWYLLLLTLGGLGLQIGWSVETSNGSPYLLSLGLSKSLLALVWIAGPLSGTLVQPYVGLKSDNCRIRWGKRRPFIIGGAIATILSLMILAWTREIVGGFLGIFGADRSSPGVKNCIILFAVVFVYVLDFAINVIQAGIRAYIVDCAPTHQQESANAWVMRTSGVGNILGYLAGYVELPKYLPWLGDSQFKVLCAIASFTMAVTVGISCSTVHERDPRFERPAESQAGLMAFFRSLFRSVRKLPPQIRKICEVQFFAWIGWFPFLFYITTYIGEIYAEPYFEANPHMSDAEIDKTWEEATRVGTLALLIFAITTFTASVFLPFIVPPTFKSPLQHPATPMTPTTPRSMHGSGYFSLKGAKRPPKTFSERISAWLGLLQIPGLTLRRAWMLSHLMFAALMWLTIFVRSTVAGIILVSLVGIPWALTSWAPFALISSEISKRDAIRRGLLRPSTREAALIAEGEDEASSGGADQAGVVLGIHNVAIAAPQVIATLVSSIIFRILQKPRGSPGDESVAWVLRLGGCCAVVAAWWTMRVGEEKEDADNAGLRRRLS